MAALRAALVVALSLACGGAPRRTVPYRTAPGDALTLYRDLAVVRQRVELELPAGSTTVKVVVATGVIATDVQLVDRGGLAVTGIRGPSDPANAVLVDELEFPPATPDVTDREPDAPDDDETLVEPPALAEPPPARTPAKPTELHLDVTAPRPGRYAIGLVYETDRLPWEIAYTLIASPARDRGELRGALAIRNETGIVVRAATASVVDDKLADWRRKQAARVARELAGGTPASTPPATPRELGAIELGDGETRVTLVHERSRPIRPVLVYDPIGTTLDHPSGTPLRDVDLGTRPRASPRVSESFELVRNPRRSAGLPAGPLRLLARRDDGTLAVLGEARLFDASTREAPLDTIPVGTAEGITGARERRELTFDPVDDRIVEEFAITLDNQRARPVDVLVREHLYRGQTWVLAYHSAREAIKEGAQQITLRTTVPARAKAKIVYVVVYTKSR